MASKNNGRDNVLHQHRHPHCLKELSANALVSASEKYHQDRSLKVLQCNFELNGQPMSTFKVGAISFSAFSGLGKRANLRSFACLPGVGPIPPGKYYIIDRQSGGLLGPLRDIFTQRSEWFALYAADSKIDDETFCNSVKRGNFRLHPKGVTGRSEGCVVIDSISDFGRLKTMLRGAKQEIIPGTQISTYGTLKVV
ncbi:MAG: DUF2778 domain-containing protein [Spongiibacteraceae bacterium]